jgi:hypothetical protein
MDFQLVIGKGRALDAKIKEIEDRHKAELAPFKEVQTKIRTLVLEELIKQGTQNVSTPAGGAHKHSRVSFSLEDPEEFKRHVIGTESWDLLDWKANATAATDFLNENQTLPPGVKRSEFVDVRFTAPTKAAPKVASPKAPSPKAPSPTAAKAGKPAPTAPGDDWEQAEAMADEL